MISNHPKHHLCLLAFAFYLFANGVVAMGEDPPLNTSNQRIARTQVLPADECRLRLRHLHTGESIDVAYRRGDVYLLDGIAMLNHFLRDSRTNEDAHYDVKEFDLLHSIMGRLGKPNGAFEIICGYRSPQTNEYLRSLSKVTGVAENSQHILSKAIDLRVPGVSTRHLRDVALSLGMGGVGYYPQSHFVHVDVGPVRQWSFGERQKHFFMRRVGRGGRVVRGG